MRTHVEKTAGQAIKGAGVPALPRNLKPRYCGNSGTQVTGGSSHVLCSFMDGHISEAGIERHDFDHLIVNNGVLDYFLQDVERAVVGHVC